jgi:hypothetical protein
MTTDFTNEKHGKDDMRPAGALTWSEAAPADAQLVDVMIDIETLGTTPGSAILSIGAVMFGPAGLGEEFYAPILLTSCTAAGLRIEPDTVLWWMKQSDAARAAAFCDDAQHLIIVLAEFGDWLMKHGAERPWCHGANFDAPLLDAAYRACGMTPPWKYWNVRDTRTLYELADVKVNRARGNHHNALDDARAQAEAAVVALQHLQSARTQPPASSQAEMLSADEINFVERVRQRPGHKLNSGEAQGSNGEPLWKRPEELGLIQVVGSYKWVVPGARPESPVADAIQATTAAPHVSEQDERALLPCPFCGSTNIDPAEWSGNDGKSGPGCGDCGALAESVDAWNRRSSMKE